MPAHKEVIYAARSLRKSPVFTLTAVLTIALGIGASTAIFSVMHAVLMRPLPYKDPEKLVFAISDMRKRNVKDFPLSNADFIDLKNATKPVFEDFAAVNTGRATVPKQDGTLEQTRFGVASPEFFRMMGAHIAFGRDFTEEDGRPIPPAPPAAPGAAQQAPQNIPAQATILSYAYFQRRFGGDASIIGRDMPGARPGTTVVVGVLAPGFELLFPSDANMERLPDTWFAARINYDNAGRNGVQWRAIGRLREGMTVERAQSALDAAAAEIRKNWVIKETSGFFIRVEPMQKHVVEEARPALLALMGAVIFLLLIACANVANLMLVRASLREKELAVRTALGGNWWRLVAQMVVEALMVAGLGALGGLMLAWAGIRELRSIAPAHLPRLDQIAINATALGFAALAALVSAAIFGLTPALRSRRADINSVLRASGRSAGLAGAGSLRSAVVVAEVALSFVLLIGSGLMIRSFIALQQINPGFDPHGLLSFQLLGNRGGPQPAGRAAFVREIQGRLRSVAGVQAATACFPFPLSGGFSPIRWGLENALTDNSKFQAVDFQVVLPGYFETMRTPVLAGRVFNDADNDPARNGVVVDDILAAKAYPKQPAVGKRILIRIRTPEPEWVEILGVVGHVRTTTLAEAGREQVYFTDGFMSHGLVNRWAIRTTGDASKLGMAVRTEMGKLGSRVVLTELQPAETLVEMAQAGTRFSLLLIGVFAVIAAVLAAVGLYGVLSTVVRQRTAEIGVRMALGAAPMSIFNLVVGHGLRLSFAGIVVGLIVAYELTRVMVSMLVGVQATDPVTFFGMAFVFLLISAVASWLPARRAAGLDPTTALREE